MPDVRSRPAHPMLGHLRLGCLLLVAALMTAGCDEPVRASGFRPEPPTGEWHTAGCEFSRPPHVMAMGGTTMPVTPPELDAAMARIDAGGRTRHADSYAGLEVDQRRVRAVVYRLPSAEFDDFVRISAEDTCVVVRDAAHSLAELTGWQSRITADLRDWTARGIRISTVGARHDGAGVEVGTQDVDQARQQMPARYGSAAPLIFIEEGPVTPMPLSGPPVVPQPGG